MLPYVEFLYSYHTYLRHGFLVLKDENRTVITILDKFFALILVALKLLVFVISAHFLVLQKWFSYYFNIFGD